LGLLLIAGARLTFGRRFLPARRLGLLVLATSLLFLLMRFTALRLSAGPLGTLACLPPFRIFALGILYIAALTASLILRISLSPRLPLFLSLLRAPLRVAANLLVLRWRRVLFHLAITLEVLLDSLESLGVIVAFRRNGRLLGVARHRLLGILWVLFPSLAILRRARLPFTSLMLGSFGLAVFWLALLAIAA
jgi:hypothetical protein